MVPRYALEGLVPCARAGVERLRDLHLHPLLTQAGYAKSRERRKRILRWHRWIGDAYQDVEVWTSTRADLSTRLNIFFEFGFRDAAALLATLPGVGLAFASDDRPVCDLADLATLRPNDPYPSVWTLTGASADERALEIAEAVKTVGLAFLDRVSTLDGALAWWSDQLRGAVQQSNAQAGLPGGGLVVARPGNGRPRRAPGGRAQQVLDRFAAVPPISATSGR